MGEGPPTLVERLQPSKISQISSCLGLVWTWTECLLARGHSCPAWNKLVFTSKQCRELQRFTVLLLKTVLFDIIAKK